MQRLDARDAGFAAAFTALVEARRESDAGVASDVAAIIADVRARGDAALFELTAKFDRIDLATTGIEVSAADIAAGDQIITTFTRVFERWKSKSNPPAV